MVHSGSIFGWIITVTFLQYIFISLFSGNSAALDHPVYPPEISDIEALKQSVAPLMRMSIKEVIGEVPEETGIFFIGCPNCHSGAEEMNVLGWKPGMGQKVR